ncbi:MAG: hypothetical protein REI96_11005 [Flavobacterium nitrogenifigens]|uniref:hypothetical protein n=1 Tax=Flavobacterium nitrogenifigens TaxID=1617283 RepID=UPI002808ADA7|nr:hypothetical protein [Flavobacterium nitrogenifigens]MDQ8012969.1 hypothetical protein [Flavobacterium nitrogenifigens]
MVKDFLISFTDNFQEKTKNPFLGTYLLVWLIRNWDLVYSLFNFDEKATRWAKIQFVKNYYSENNFIENLFINILWSFGLLILTYFLLNVSRFIVNISEKRLTPWIYKITDSKSIVLKEDYDRLRAENDDLQIRLDNERQSKTRLEAIIKNQDESILELSKTQTESKSTNENFDGEQDVEELLDRIQSANNSNDFEKICLLILKGKPISDAENNLDFFIKLGLIVFEKRVTSALGHFKLTPLGQRVFNRMRIINNLNAS